MRKLTRLVLVLGLVGFISGGALGAFYSYASPIIMARQLQEVIAGLKSIFPEAESFGKMDAVPADFPGALYEAFGSARKRMGIVIETASKGYVADINLLIGIDPDNQKVTTVKIMRHQETPGLGSKIEEPAFLDQFKGKSILDYFRIGQDIDGITAATVSANAVASAVGQQSRAVLKLLGQDVAELPPAPVEEPPPAEEPPVAVDLAVMAGELWTKMGAIQLAAIEAPAAFTVQEKVYQVKSEKGESLGLLLVVEGTGYVGPMQVAVGINKDLTNLTGVRLLENMETPGLGTKVGEEPFIGQFVGKSIRDAFILGQDVDGITMATGSAKGFVEAVREKARIAAEYYRGRL